MAITFRKFTASVRLSQETTAYDTQVLFQGKLIGFCSNDGGGGMGRFCSTDKSDPELIQKAEEWACEQTIFEEDGRPMTHNGQIMKFQSLEDYCDSLASKTLADRQLRSSLQRLLKSNVLFVSEDAQKPGVLQIKRPWTEDLAPHFRNRYPKAVVLNELPIQDAMRVYEEQERLMAAKDRNRPKSPRP